MFLFLFFPLFCSLLSTNQAAYIGSKAPIFASYYSTDAALETTKTTNKWRLWFFDKQDWEFNDGALQETVKITIQFF